MINRFDNMKKTLIRAMFDKIRNIDDLVINQRLKK